MIKSTILTIAAGQILSRLKPQHKQTIVDVAKTGVNKINNVANKFLDGLTEQHETRVNEMLERGELYFKGGKLYYTETNELFTHIK